jgi:hypothetical protein
MHGSLHWFAATNELVTWLVFIIYVSWNHQLVLPLSVSIYVHILYPYIPGVLPISIWVDSPKVHENNGPVVQKRKRKTLQLACTIHNEVPHKNTILRWCLSRHKTSQKWKVTHGSMQKKRGNGIMTPEKAKEQGCTH